MAAAVAIGLYTAILIVAHWLAYLAPPLEGHTLAKWAFLWTIFGFTLDFWRLKDDNRHGKLLSDGGYLTFHRARSLPLYSKPTTYVTVTVFGILQ